MSKNIVNIDLLTQNLNEKSIESNYTTTILGLNQVELIEDGVNT
jgi:hypothetical protein